jgi:hypothetical protein
LTSRFQEHAIPTRIGDEHRWRSHHIAVWRWDPKCTSIVSSCRLHH